MKKRYLYPIWKLDIIEEQLRKMEQNGYRLDKVTPFRTFHFVSSKPKDVQYFSVCSIIREFASTYSTEQSLLENGATKIKGSLFGFTCSTDIYRITKSTEMKEKHEYRNIYLQRVVLQRFIISIIIALLTLLCTVLQCISLGIEGLLENAFSFVLVCSIFTISFLYALHNLYGFIFLRKQYKTKYFTRR